MGKLRVFTKYLSSRLRPSKEDSAINSRLLISYHVGPYLKACKFIEDLITQVKSGNGGGALLSMVLICFSNVSSSTVEARA